jgi:hypothetical protein
VRIERAETPESSVRSQLFLTNIPRSILLTTGGRRERIPRGAQAT